MIDTNKNTEHSPKWITITGVVTKPYFEELMDGREPFHDVKWDIQEYDEDTPKLLAEVKLILAYIRRIGTMEKRKNVSGFFLSIMKKVLTEEEYEQWRSECK